MELLYEIKNDLYRRGYMSNISNTGNIMRAFYVKNKYPVIESFYKDNPNITWEIISDNLDKEWHWKDISRRPENADKNRKQEEEG